MTSRHQIVEGPRARRARVLGKPAIYKNNGSWLQIEWTGPGEWWVTYLRGFWPSFVDRLDKGREVL